MLNLSETRIGKSFSRTIATGVTIDQEGTPLVYARQGDDTVVIPATANTTDIFAGVALTRNNSLTRATFVEIVKVPHQAPYTIVLQNTPNSFGTMRITAVGGSATHYAQANPPVAGTSVTLTGATLTFASGDADISLEVAYSYTPSVMQAIQAQGQAPAGGLPSTNLGVIGVINQGDISTNMYDTACDWSSSLTVNVSNGLFTTAAGSPVPGATILRAPTGISSSLILSLR